MKSSILLFLSFTICGISSAQKFPFNIDPMSSPMEVKLKQPIQFVSSEDFQDIATYKFVNTVILQGVSFRYVFLYFENSKLIRMTFNIKEKSDCTKVISALSVKYKKAANCNFNTPYCYRNGNLLIHLSKLESPDEAGNCGYLFYEYQASGDF